jgi:hypothetical protein
MASNRTTGLHRSSTVDLVLIVEDVGAILLSRVRGRSTRSASDGSMNGSSNPSSTSRCDSGFLCIEGARIQLYPVSGPIDAFAYTSEANSRRTTDMLKHDPAHESSQPDYALSACTRTGLVEVGQRTCCPAMSPKPRAAALDRESPDELLAETQFMLAQALWDAPPDRGRDRPRAMALAQEARDALAKLGVVSADALAELERWLADRCGDV